MVTRDLKNYGVEVYFVEDNIDDGRGRRTSTYYYGYACTRVEKTSERVRGQKISRDKASLHETEHSRYDQQNTGT